MFNIRLKYACGTAILFAFVRAGLIAPVSAATPAPTSAPVVTPAPLLSSLSAQQQKSLTLLDLIAATRRIVDQLEAGENVPLNVRLADATRELDAAVKIFRAMDEALNSNASHWTWTPMQRIALEEANEEKFQIDPPLANGAAIAFSCNRKVRIESIKVLDASGISTVFPINATFGRDAKREIKYLYYPTAISNVIISYRAASDAGGNVSVFGGVTDLPEYGKEALYWFVMARNQLAANDAAKAAEYLKLSIKNAYLFRLSRGVK